MKDSGLAAQFRGVPQESSLRVLAPGEPPAHAGKYFAAAYRCEGVPEVGHFLQREDPAGVAERIVHFIQEHQT